MDHLFMECMPHSTMQKRPNHGISFQKALLASRCTMSRVPFLAPRKARTRLGLVPVSQFILSPVYFIRGIK